MAFNLFDNILQSSTNKFLGTQPSVPSTPSFTTPQAPKTVGYTPPVTVKKTTPTLRNNWFAPWYENTVDQTQSPVFKVVQAGADLFTGITKRLGETVQQDKTKFEQDVKKKQVDFANAMLSKGYAKEDIFKKLNELKAKWEFDFKPWVAESIVGGVGERMQSVWETTQKLSQIQNPLERTFAGVIPYAGQTVASVTQPLTSWLEPFVSPVVKAIVEKTGQTQNIQDLSNQWSQFEKTNPILAENIAGALNVSQLLPLPFVKPIANATTQWIKTATNTVLKTAENIAPKATAIIKKPVQIIKNKATDIFWKELRPVQDIAGNILQPYKWMVENLDDATNGLRRVVEETWTNTDTFEGLLWKIDESLTKYGKMKQESLSQITQTQKSVSAQKALENLENVYDWVSSKEMLSTQLRIRQLAKKNMQEWLTPLEMDEVKVLHTKANNLFNEKWQTTGWFSSDDLRGIRKDLKNEIEDFAEANWVTNIREINKAYWEIADAKTLAQNQVDNLKAYKGRQIPATRIQKIADFIMEFPVVKQAFSDPARILASSLFKTLRWDKINPIEVQKRLPNFLKELKDAWMRSWDLKKIEMMIQNEMKLLPAPTGKPLSSNVVNVKPSTWTPKIDAMVGKQWNIPWTSRKETVIKPEFRTPQAPRIVKNIKEETRPNPSILAKNKWVIVWEQKLLPAPKKLKNGNTSNNRASSTTNSKKIVKPNTIKNESKVNKPKPKSVSVDTNNKQQVSNLEKEYVTKMKKWKNLVIDSDKIKEQFSDYDPKNPTTVHEKSSELSKIYYKNALKDQSYKKVVLTAWGGGSGKSEILVSGIPQDSGTLVFDWTGKNFKKIVSQYDEAKKAWKDAEIKAVYIDYNKAKQFNAKRDRTVAEDILADTHKGYRKTLLQIAKERPDINISLTINKWERWANGKAKVQVVRRKNIVKFLEKVQELE